MKKFYKNLKLKGILLSCMIIPFSSYSSATPPVTDLQIPPTTISIIPELKTKPVGFIYDLEVIDGDTIKARWTVPYPQLETIYLRVYGVDAPELFHSKCQKERDLAEKTKEELDHLVKQGVRFDIISWDKYGGRILVKLTTKDGQSIPELMIAKGLAIPYFGEKKTKDWCSQQPIDSK